MSGLGCPNTRALSAALDPEQTRQLVRAAAELDVRTALEMHHTQREAAEYLGVPLRALQRFLARYPELRNPAHGKKRQDGSEK